MDESEPDKSKPELSDSWMVINDSPADQEINGRPSDGSDGESVEVIDQEEYEEALVEGNNYETIPPGQEFAGSKNKKYVHHPNNDINAALNKLMIIAASIVVGLAVGHYLGYSEVADVTSSLKKLKAENTILKNQICKLFENYEGHNTESPHTELKWAYKGYSLYHMILLDVKCPELEAQTGGIQEDLDEIRQAYAKGHLSGNELQERIDKLLQNRTQSDVGINGQSSIKLLHSEGETVIIPGERLVDTASAVERSEHSTKINLDSEESVIPKSYESVYSFKAPELPGESTFEKLFENFPTQTDDTVITAKSEASKTSMYNLLTETTVDFKGTDERPSNSESQNYLYKLEPPTENMLKHVVKDMVQEMTESLLLSHHNNIIKDIRDETKIIFRSVPVFKSVLLLNMEVISKLKSHVRYMKNTFKSFLDHSHGSTQQKKLTSILNDVSKHTLSLEKAMSSLQLLEAALDQKKGFPLKSHQVNTCTATEFFEKFYVTTFLITEDTKNHSFHNHEEESGNYFNNSQKENCVFTESNLSSNNNTLDDTSIKDIPHKSKAEKNSGEKVQIMGAIKQEENKAIPHDDYTDHELPSRPKEKLPPGYQVPKGKLATDKLTGTSKQGEPELHPNENNSYNTKCSDNKHGVKYQSSKKMKGNKKEQKKVKKEKYYNKHDKKFKRDLQYAKKKHGHYSNSWVGNDNEKRNNNISGEWVINLNMGRAESRETEHRSDWLFDRASARKVKRNGKWNMSNWYFERAESRNYCRQKSNNDKNKINCSPENTGKQFHGKDKKKFSKFRKHFKPEDWLW